METPEQRAPVSVVEAFAGSLEERQARVSRAAMAAYTRMEPLNDGSGLCREECDGYPVSVFEDRVVVASEGRMFQHPYTISDDGTVTLGEGVEVIADYRPISTLTPEQAEAAEEDMSGDMSEAAPTATREAAALVEAVAGAEGREWDVILIAAGLSKNGNYYPPETLRASAPLFEGAVSYADHSRTGGERSVRDKVGRFTGPEYGLHTVRGRMVEGIKARFLCIAPWLRETLREAVAANEPDFLGFSIDAEGRTTPRQESGRTVNWVESLVRVRSVDVVTDPAAGGQIVRLVAGLSAGTGTGEGTTQEEAAMTPDEIKALVAEGVAAALREQVQAAPPAAAAESEVLQEARRLAQESARRLSLAHLSEALAGSTLSEVSRTRLRTEFTEALGRRAVEDSEIDTRVQEQTDFEAALFAQVTRPFATARAQAGDGERDRYVKALTGMFEGRDVDGVPQFLSLKEAYCRWTGSDPFAVSAQEIQRAFVTRYDSNVDHRRVTESLQTSDWGQVYADVFYLQMVKGYNDAPYDEWRSIVSDIENVPDFRTRHWVRVGGYSNLSTVSEQQTYPTLTSPGDEEVTYAIAKYGGIDDVTFEAITNDRIGAIRKIPGAMGRAAKRTLRNTIMNLATTTNSTMDYDSTALYHANHNNTGTTALSLAGLATTIQVMRDQTAYGETSEILGPRNKPKFIIVPNELEFRAKRIVSPGINSYVISPTDDTGTGVDPNAFAGMNMGVIVYDVMTDANDWFAVADPAEVPTIVVGFLNGQQTPELFIADQPNVGSTFTADKISYKIRFAFGADVLDHRSFYRQVVT